MPYFAQHGYECFAVSMRAHGRSDAAGGADGHMADQIADLASVIASLPQPPILVAHSLGGIVAQRWVASDVCSKWCSNMSWPGLHFGKGVQV